jgi:phosphotransferase system HPr-like phosphotransfer protein
MTEITFEFLGEKDIIESVKRFVKIVSDYKYDIDVTSGRYVVNAKSIMGMFSLDLARTMKMTIHSKNCGKLLDELSEVASLV